MMGHRLRFLALSLLLPVGSVLAHHSYAMFDTARTGTVTGTVAKLEWTNPHAFLWVYVPNRDKPGTYDLWGFENGSPSVLQGHGWNKEVGSSRVDLQACKLEYSIVSPK